LGGRGDDGSDDGDGGDLRSGAELAERPILIRVSSGEIKSVRISCEKHCDPEHVSLGFGEVGSDGFDLSHAGGLVAKGSVGVALFLDLVTDVFGRVEVGRRSRSLVGDRGHGW
jgi:hypothetical protein